MERIGFKISTLESFIANCRTDSHFTDSHPQCSSVQVRSQLNLSAYHINRLTEFV